MPGMTADHPGADRRRRAVGRTATVLAVLVGAAALVLLVLAPRTVLVGGGGAVGRPALAGALLAAGAAAAAGHLTAREPGPWGPVERTVGWGVALGFVPFVGLGVPLVGFVLAMAATWAPGVVLSPRPLAGLAAAVTVGTLAARRPGSRAVSVPGRVLLAGGTAVLTGTTLLHAWIVGDDEVVVAGSPGTCTAVVRQTQTMFSGEVELFVAPPGSAVAHLRASYPLEETFPFRDDTHRERAGYVLAPGPRDVHIDFEDGMDGVDEVVPCR